MQLLWLHYFMSVAKYQSISKAAVEHGIPTPAMSATIKRLEMELGARLFDRAHNRITLNEKGSQFNTYVARAMESLVDAVNIISEDPASPTGNIRILLMDNRNYIMERIFQMMDKYPKIKFSVIHNYSNPKEYDCDLCISARSFHPSFDAHMPLVEDHLLIGVSANHRLANREVVDVHELQDERFIAMPFTSSLTQMALEAFRRHGVEPNIVITCDDWRKIQEFVERGLGTTFVPSNPWNGFRQEPFRLLRINESDMVRTTYAFWNSTKHVPLAVRVFLNELSQSPIESMQVALS